MAGMGLANYGMDQQAEATGVLQKAAADEAQRNIRNKETKAAARQGNMALGSALGGLAGSAIAGASYGSSAGPYGAIIGGVVGALAGNFFD